MSLRSLSETLAHVSVAEELNTSTVQFGTKWSRKCSPEMKIRIYELLTQENNIMLSSEALSYLESNVKDDEMLRKMVSEYKRLNGPRMGDVNIFKDIFKRIKNGYEDKGEYNITSQEYMVTNYPLRYKFLRNKIEEIITPIYLLSDGTQSLIFGCYYRNRDGVEVLEDDSGVVHVDMSKCTDDGFVCENIFIALKGMMSGGSFIVSKFCFPRIQKSIAKKANPNKRNLRFLFFSDFRINEINGDILEKILRKMSVDVVVLMGKLCSERSSFISLFHLLDRFERKRHLVASKTPDILLCPDADDMYPSFLPKQICFSEKYSTVKAVTNPFTLEVANHRIGVIRDDMFRYKDVGTFFGANHVDSFARSILSQYSFNPFGLSNLAVDTIPDVFVVGQDFYPFITSVEDVLFVSCPSFREEMAFVLYDLPSKNAQVVYCRDVLMQCSD